MGFFSNDSNNKVLRINPGYTGSSFGEITNIDSDNYSVGTLVNGSLQDVTLNLSPTLVGATGYIMLTFSIIPASGNTTSTINEYIYPKYGKTFSGNYTILTKYDEGLNVSISDDLSKITLLGTQQKTTNNFSVTKITANIVKENNGIFSTMYFGDGSGREKKVKGMYYSFGNGKFVDLFNPMSTIAPTTISPTTVVTTTTTTTTTTQYVPPVVYPVNYTVGYSITCSKTVSWVSSIPARADGYFVGEYLGNVSIADAIHVTVTPGVSNSWPVSFADGGNQVFNSKGEHSYTYRYDGSGTVYYNGSSFYMVGGSVTDIV
ncbi:hypothetical protein [Levilactobacillus phage ENFP1]|nr:hypothetical protein [Levilactobacillus phage ENFP1]